MIVLSILLQILAGWLLADFATGILHWIEDRFGPGREDWPLVGPLVFAPNQRHHFTPLEFTWAGFFDRNWTTWVAVLIFAIPLFLLVGVKVWLVVMVIGGGMSNEVHAWAHRFTMLKGFSRKLLRAVQQTGLLQSPAHHAVHHVPPHRRHYCILTNWLNPVLDGFGFWGLLEKPIPARWLS